MSLSSDSSVHDVHTHQNVKIEYQTNIPDVVAQLSERNSEVSIKEKSKDIKFRGEGPGGAYSVSQENGRGLTEEDASARV